MYIDIVLATALTYDNSKLY